MVTRAARPFIVITVPASTRRWSHHWRRPAAWWACLLREGNAGPAEDADIWIPHLVQRLNESTAAQVRVRNDAGFTDNATLEALEERDIEYLGRLRSHTGLQKLYLKRPRGRSPGQPRKWCHDLAYQAGAKAHDTGGPRTSR